MPTPGPAVDAYLEHVDEPRRAAVRRLRELCLEHLVRFEELVRYGGDRLRRPEAVQLPLRDPHRRHGGAPGPPDRAEGGKGCIRYRGPEQIDEAVVRSILEQPAATRGPIC